MNIKPAKMAAILIAKIHLPKKSMNGDTWRYHMNIYEYMISMNIIYMIRSCGPPERRKKKIETCFHDGKDPASAFPGIQPFYHSPGVAMNLSIKSGFQKKNRFPS